MDVVADQVESWSAAGRQITVVRVVGVQGLSGEHGTPIAALTPGTPVAGTVLSGAVDDALAAHAAALDAARVVEMPIGDVAAQAAGMSCGGVARVLLQPCADLPAEFWELLAAREPVCVITELSGDVVGATRVFTRPTIAEAEARYPGVARLFNRGASTNAVLDGAAVTTVWPVPTLVVVGDGLIAAALAAQAALLGWTCSAVNDADAARAAIDGLAACDGVVVLSHSRDVDGPALVAALGGQAGYIGALGARHTQSARAQWLAAHDVTDLGRVHGPAGLDLGARTPAEIAVSIVAEMLADRAGRPPIALRDRGGPVHHDGLNAPPPRYDLPPPR